MTKEVTKAIIDKSTTVMERDGERNFSDREIIRFANTEDFSPYVFERMYISENYPSYDTNNYGSNWFLTDEDSIITLDFSYN